MKPWLARLIVAMAVLFAVAVLTLAITVKVWTADLPNLDEVRAYRPPESTWLLDKDGRLIGEFFEERRRCVATAAIPRHFFLSVLAAEDANFFQHGGFDATAIGRAVLYRVTGRQLQGGSTLTQQLVKLLLLNPERTLKRKVREVILARRVEAALSKEEILTLYANHVNFGHGRYGISEASRYYFGKAPKDLDLAESALLAGLPQAPARLSPRVNLDAAQRRRSYVLRQLAAKRSTHWPDLSAEAISAAGGRPIEITPPPSVPDGAFEVLSEARERLAALHPKINLNTAGLTVTLTLDLSLQTQARAALAKQLGELDARLFQRFLSEGLKLAKVPKADAAEPQRGALLRGELAAIDATSGAFEVRVGSRSYRLATGPNTRDHALRGKLEARFKDGKRAVPVRFIGGERVEVAVGPEGAIVVIDPHEGALRALVGSRADRPGFNRAVAALRQPGSAFKPIVFGQALTSGRYTHASRLFDAPVSYEAWQPQNYEPWHFRGQVSLREALAQSINLAAVRLTESVTVPEVIRFAQSLGITRPLTPDLSLALGSSEVTVLELTQAYAVFAAGGIYRTPRLIAEVRDPKGARLEAEVVASRRVTSEASAYLLTSLLRSVVTSGTGRRAQALPFETAGKTGTSNRARDAWFVGYSTELCAGVWVGFDDRRVLGAGEGGSSVALPIWVATMQAAASKPAPFAAPSSLVALRLDPQTGRRLKPEQAAAGQGELAYFIPGTEPPLDDVEGDIDASLDAALFEE